MVSFYAGRRASGKSSTATMRPTRISTFWKSAMSTRSDMGRRLPRAARDLRPEPLADLLRYRAGLHAVRLLGADRRGDDGLVQERDGAAEVGEADDLGRRAVGAVVVIVTKR